MAAVIGLTLPLIIPTAPTSVEAASFGTGRDHSFTCGVPRMYVAPTFSTNPKGSASYPFGAVCYANQGPGAMDLHFEGRWNPSETRPDRPNAVETLTISGYEQFLQDRKPKGSIFLYWTARCNADPWLQGGNCVRMGAYVPDDIRASFPEIDNRQFPLTGNSISAPMKQALIIQYQAANAPVSAVQRMTVQPLSQQQRVQSMIIQPQQSQVITQSQRSQVQAMTVQPQTALPNSNTAASSLSRSGIFARGVEEKEGQTSGQQDKDAQPEIVETSDMAVLEEGTPEIVEPVTVTLDHPVHVTNAKGDAVVLKPGVYEIGAVMDVQLGLAKEGQPTVLLHARPGTHNESIKRTIALAIPGQSGGDVHLLFLKPDGKLFDAIGSSSEVKTRGTDMMATLPDQKIKDAVVAASVKPRSVSSPACQPNPAETGPRWIPVPCTIAAGPAATP